MKLFDYQQFWEERKAYCASCDIAYYKTTEESSNWCFQVGLDTISVPIANNDFAHNPFDLITLETGEFTFDLTVLPPEIFMEFVIYMCGKVFRFKKMEPGTLIPTNNYSLTTTGNVYEFQISSQNGISTTESLTNFNNNLIEALNQVVDVVCGCTSSHSTIAGANHFLFTGVTGSVYTWNGDGVLSDVTLSTPSGIISKEFIYQDGRVCYNRNTGAFVHYQFLPIALVSGTRYKLSIDYSSDYSDFIMSWYIYNGIIDQVLDFTVNVTSSGRADVYFTANASVDTIITLRLTDPITGLHNSGFCFDNITLESVCRLGNATIDDVTNGIDQEVFSVFNGNMTVDYYGNKALVCINAYSVLINHPPNDCYQMTINDNCGNSIKTNYFKFFTGGCNQNKFIQLDWFGDCRFKDLDYLNLPFINTMFVRGYVVAIPGSLDDRTTTRNPDGSEDTLFSLTAERYEINIGKYSSVMHNQLFRIFEHKFVFVNNEVYYKSGKDVYVPAPLSGTGYYTGRIELTKKGTEVIASSCCC